MVFEVTTHEPSTSSSIVLDCWKLVLRGDPDETLYMCLHLRLAQVGSPFRERASSRAGRHRWPWVRRRARYTETEYEFFDLMSFVNDLQVIIPNRFSAIQSLLELENCRRAI